MSPGEFSEDAQTSHIKHGPFGTAAGLVKYFIKAPFKKNIYIYMKYTT